MRKTKRDLTLINLRKANPEWSLKEIGEIFWISKQRVHQIIKRHNSADGALYIKVK